MGTVVPNQQRAHLYVVESGTAADAQYVELGTCVVDPLPPVPTDVCTYDASGNPLPIPPLDVRYTCRPDPSKGIECAKVVALVLIAVFAVKLGWFPSSTPPSFSSPLDQIHAMLLPAITLVAVLFGYIARMARAGTIEALAADYTRTATLKGLPRRTVLRRHVLRNALLPTIAVVATQAGFLLGGLLVTETLFNYPGIGRLVYTAAKGRDIPMMMAGVITVGAIFMLLTLVADVLTAWLNPRVRLGSAAE